jgi:hypothetical protein
LYPDYLAYVSDYFTWVKALAIMENFMLFAVAIYTFGRGGDRDRRNDPAEVRLWGVSLLKPPETSCASCAPGASGCGKPTELMLSTSIATGNGPRK